MNAQRKGSPANRTAPRSTSQKAAHERARSPSRAPARKVSRASSRMRKRSSPWPQVLACTAAFALLIGLIVLPRLLSQPADFSVPVEPVATPMPSPTPDAPLATEVPETAPLAAELSETAAPVTPRPTSALVALIDEPWTEPETTDPAEADPALINGGLPLLEIEPNSSIKSKKIDLRYSAIKNDKRVDNYERKSPIAMGNPENYAQLPGVTTFRGDNWRGNSAYGLIPESPSKLEVMWNVKVGGIDSWSGVGWTGQAAIVEWPAQVREQMNLNKKKKAKDGLREVIIGALDGKIRFLDLDDGEATRESISIGAPIKGSVTIDPRGYPILYCGQGLFEVGGRTVKCGTRIISLIDHKLLLFINGQDEFRTRNWYCFDAAPIVDGATDTMFQIGENGLLYSVQLGTNYNQETGKIRLNPQVDRWGYKSAVTKRPGMENSLAIYNHYGFFVDNSGLMICLDLNNLEPVWALAMGDDTDATTAIEQDEEGVWLYTGNEMDLRGNAGKIQMRCINALTGEQRWKGEANVSNRSFAGAFASPAVGQNELSELVFFHISKTNKGATLYALDKKTGDPVWTEGLGFYGWSTPSLLYDENGRGYILIGSSNGKLRLLDGLTGKLITSIDLKSNIEGSPAVFDDMAVVSTRGGRIFGVKIS